MKRFTEVQKKSKITKLFEQEIELTPVTKEVQPEAEPKPQTQSTPVKFFSKLLESREMAQVYHWTVKGDMGSHAAHLALEAYYDGVIEFIDELVEVYSGQYNIIEGYDVIDTTETKNKEKIEYFSDVAEFIKSERNICLSKEDTHLQNIVDEVLALVYKTLYKLKYNK